MKRLLILSVFFIITLQSTAQLKPGFDKDEYIELMKVSSRMGDSVYYSTIPAPEQFRFNYRSPVVGLDNLWELWTSGGKTAVISLRGTTKAQVSWLENFYLAMTPASGSLSTGAGKFEYRLAAHPQATVHVGWLTGLAYLSPTILSKLDSCYNAGYRDFYIMGHSQGGALAYLLTAHLYQLRKQGRLSPTIRFKTYCSAAPKPGNLYFAYEYEAMTREGWAFNVVNSVDWVPETPVTVQTLDDFNKVNPFLFAQETIRKLKFPQDIVMGFAFKQLDMPTKKARNNFERFMGKELEKSVKKELPGFEPPPYYPSVDYVRTGQQVVLLADEAYFQVFPQDPRSTFMNHWHHNYLYLAYRQLSGVKAEPLAALNGWWQLEYITGSRISFDGLYPDKKPSIHFQLAEKKISGNSSCNNFSGALNADGFALDLSRPMAMTKMACPGGGEEAFLKLLPRITAYSIENNTLSLMMDDVVAMRFRRASGGGSR